MKRLGFIDHVLDNWHANVYVDVLRNQLKHREFDVTGCMASDHDAGQRWASQHDVPYFSDVRAMNERVDACVILAPSNPERHLELCQRVFPLGKPTFVDKTFAPNLAIARDIFALAARHRVPVQTSSALRYTNVQAVAKQLGRVQHMVAWGGGSSFAEYAIHVVEMIVSCMADAQAVSLMRRGGDPFSQLLINFTGGRTTVGNVYLTGDTPFAASLTSADKTVHVPVDVPSLYTNAISATLDFFESGTPNVPREQSLLVRRILDVAETPEAREGFVQL
jgi:hypothetical protein